MEDKDTPDDLELLRRFLPESRPPEGAKERARSALLREIQRPPAPARSNWRIAAAMAAALLTVMAVLIYAVALRPSPAAAALSELAQVAERQPSIQIVPGRYLYSRSEQLVLVQVPGEELPAAEVPVVSFLLPSTREVWEASDGSRVIRTAAREPRFLSDRTASAFAASELPQQFGVGKTTIEAFAPPENDFNPEQWPTNPEELESTLRAAVEQAGTQPVESGLVDLAVSLLRETGASPALRSAILRVLSTLDRLTLAPAQEQDTTRVSLTYSSDGIRTVRTLAFDSRSAQLREESTRLLDPIPSEGIPADTVISHIWYEASVASTEPPPTSA